MEQISENKKKHPIWRLIFLAVFIFVIGSVATVFTDHYLFPKLSANPLFSKYKFLKETAENVTIINKTEQLTVREDDSIAKVASQAAASVVEITSTGDLKTGLGSQKGSGIILTSDGIIATYRTAINEARGTSYKAYLNNGNELDAKLEAIDDFTNLAYLKVDASNLPTISFANSDDLYAGKKLISISSEAGQQQNRFATGILSLRDKTFNIAGKTVSSSEKLEGVFNVDFNTLQPGSAIIDYNGNLEGIVGELNLNNEAYHFAIPTNNIKNSLDLKIKNKLADRPILGVYYLSVTKEIQNQQNLNADHGALIFSPSGKQGLAILSNSPAEKAGLRVGDVILKINDEEINLDNPLSEVLNRFEKGKAIDLTIERNKESMRVSVSL